MRVEPAFSVTTLPEAIAPAKLCVNVTLFRIRPLAGSAARGMREPALTVNVP